MGIVLNRVITAMGTDGDGLGPASLVPLSELSWRGVAAVCERSLWAGDADETARIVAEALRRRVDLGVVYEGVIAPALRRIDDLWDPTAEGIDRSRATETALSAMRAAAETVNLRRGRPSRRVVFATDVDERHTVGLQMAAGVLECAGHEAIRCATGTGLGRLIDTAREREADAIALSCTTDASGEHLAATAAAIWEAVPSLPVIVGGRGVPTRLPVGPIVQVQRLDDLTDALAGLPRST